MNELPIQYHELETIYSNSIGRGYRSIAITSSDIKEGVTTLASAIARRSEAGGHKTLIVDLNLRHSSQGHEHGLKPTSWNIEDDHIVTKAIKLSNENISVIPSPSLDQNLLKIRERRLIENSIKRWKEHYDVIILDTSPLNAINRNNIPAELICASCDATIFVVMAGKTLEKNVKQSYTRLSNAKANLLGTVINDQHNPNLVDELIRETYRLQRVMPNVMNALRRKLRKSEIINQR